jgi:hypothetical protein
MVDLDGRGFVQDIDRLFRSPVDECWW